MEPFRHFIVKVYYCIISHRIISHFTGPIFASIETGMKRLLPRKNFTADN